MLREKIDDMIMEATVASANYHDKKFEVECLRLIKAEFLRYNASKEAVKKPMDDAVEISILKKMVKQRDESGKLYMDNGRDDLANRELAEAEIIEGFLPEEVGADVIEDEVDSIIASGVVAVKKNMGGIIKAVKEKYPMADGKMISGIVLKKLK